MVRGNIALSTGKSAEAIEHYTEVLYKLSPGHVCAFLNRSMAYLNDGYYELAAMDAHRAKIAADDLRKTNPVADQRLTQVTKYIKAERLHVGANDDWTKEAQRNIGEGWSKSPLASILVTATPDFKIPPFGTSKKSLARALEIRATYRLCGALFMVGDGARKDALDLIEDMKLSLRGKKSYESYWFSKLGNDILAQLDSEVDPKDSMATRVAGSNTGANRDERMKNLTEMMKATTTHYRYGDYPWNTDEPELGSIDWQTRLQEWLKELNNTISAVVVGSNGTEESQNKPHCELRAPRDVDSGELMLERQSISDVATCMLDPIKEEDSTQTKSGLKPKPSEQKNSPVTLDSLEFSYCTGCASLLGFPRKFALKVQTEQARKRPKYFVHTCSEPCRKLRLNLNIGLCRDNIERDLRKEHLEEHNPRLMTDCKTLYLRDLIFLRHVVMAMKLGKSPLGLRNLMFATCGPHTRGVGQITEADPWSYMSHVVRPLKYLDKSLAYTKTDQFANLDKFDGWIIHALLSKISRSMRIFMSPQYAQVFHKDGTPKIAFGPEHPLWEDLTKLPQDKEDESLVWVAGLETLVNMIRIADPAKGESPNVVLVQKEYLYIYAIKTDDGGPAIKAGETLLRAADGAENQGLLEEKVYPEEELNPDFLAVTDDEEDGDEGQDDDKHGVEDKDNEEEDDNDNESEAHSGDTSEFLEESSAEEEDNAEDEDEVDGQAVLPTGDPAKVEDENEEEEEVEIEEAPVPPAQDPRVGEWWSSWSWRAGRLHMG